MLKIHIQHKAKADLNKIWSDSYKEWGEEQADKYFDALDEAISQTLLNNPKIGFSCDYIRIGYRQYQVNKHLIFYRLTSKKIHIIRVLHQRMSSKQHL